MRRIVLHDLRPATSIEFSPFFYRVDSSYHMSLVDVDEMAVTLTYAAALLDE